MKCRRICDHANSPPNRKDETVPLQFSKEHDSARSRTESPTYPSNREGTYYLHLRGRSGYRIFLDTSDAREFEALIARAADKDGLLIHAFCWTPTAARLLIELDGVPVSNSLDRIVNRYSDHLRRRPPHQREFLIVKTCELLHGDVQFLRIFKLISTTPRDESLVSDQNAIYRWSHERTYLGLAQCNWLTTSRTLRLLASAQVHDQESYRLFTRSGRIVASWRDFEPLVPRRAKPSGLNGHQLAFDWLTTAISERTGVSRETLLSGRRTSQASRARALLAYHARRNQIASITDVARRPQ